VHPALGETDESVIAAASSAEMKSEHPLARAVMQRAEELNVTITAPDDFISLPGRGIRCGVGGMQILVGNRALMEENSVEGQLPPHGLRKPDVQEVFVARDGRLLGRIHITDKLRPEAKQAVADLKALGIRPLLLTGDAERTARSVAAQLDIGEYAAGLKPEDKRRRVALLQEQGHVTAMLGDGVNDAPALTEAAVGVAIGSGTDVALESAAVVLIGSDLSRFVEAVRIARRCRRVIWFNFAGTLVVDAIGMGLAFAGMLNPLLAALVHVGSELAFILNSARLFPVFDRKRPNDEDHSH
jgi:Cu+-exporting ATPase